MPKEGITREQESRQLDPTLWGRATDFLWARVKEREGECWEDIGHCNKRNGYGMFTLWVRGAKKGQQFYSHRVAYEDMNGPFEGHVLHKCDNPKCCRPSHLFLGDQTSNVADMNAKGRHVRGDDCNFAKLTEAQALEVIDLGHNGVPKKQIAVKFGVHPRHVQRIIKGERWAHLPRPTTKAQSKS